jgi:hypothetical protein
VVGGWEGFRVRVERLPVRACASGCRDRRPATPGFAAAVLEALLAGAVLPLARRDASATSAGEWRCARCSNRQLTSLPGESIVRGTVVLPGLEPFAVAIAAPACACVGCGVVQLRPAGPFADALARALDDVWRAAGVRAGFR